MLKEADGALLFTQDYGFEYPSGAAAIVSGSTVSGKTAWHLADGRTLKQWEQEQLDAAEAHGASA